MLFSPRGEAPRRFSFYLLEATRGFISARLYHFGAAAKPAKHFAGFLHPPIAFPTTAAIAWHVKTSCLGGGKDRCEGWAVWGEGGGRAAV